MSFPRGRAMRRRNGAAPLSTVRDFFIGNLLVRPLAEREFLIDNKVDPDQKVVNKELSLCAKILERFRERLLY